MENTNWTQIDVVSTSDWHLGHPKNPAEDVIRGLDKKLSYKYLNGCNFLFIVGDVFDRILSLNHKDIPHIVSWVARLLARCAKRGIIVMVLEGTPSHDRLQSHVFTAVNESADEDNKARLIYVKEVSIEYIEEYDINILCIPDEKNTSDDITYEQVKSMMKARALDKVDFALIHGFFDFQVPVGRHTRYHDSDRYNEIVRYGIFVGHDHTFQQNGKIFIQGSPDRQRHGMQEPKGFVRAVFQRDGTFKAKFEVNEYACRFDSIELDGADSNTYLSAIDSRIRDLPPGSHIRIICDSNHDLSAGLDELSLRYPFYHFTKKIVNEEEKEINTIFETKTEEVYVPMTIDPSNIKSIVIDRVMSSLSTDEEKQYLDQLMDSII